MSKDHTCGLVSHRHKIMEVKSGHCERQALSWADQVPSLSLGSLEGRAEGEGVVQGNGS